MDFQQLGPYEIGVRLGKGGMGSVYRGVNVETGEPAAIKVLAPQLAMAEGFRERFEAEIESLETLQHEGIVRLFGYGEESGNVFYAMQLVEGRSLEEELKAGRRFNWREVVDITIQVCKALKHAHDHGIIHRDIKPANILLDADENVKLADFGIARLFGSSQMTMAGGVLGTADYMSPEQAEGKPVTDRCDQYSLGCVMYALLAGRPPFQAKSLPEMLQLQRFAEPEPVRRYARRAPAQLEMAISQLLSKDPLDRFPNTLVVARHLEAMRRALSRPFEESPDPSPATNGDSVTGDGAPAGSPQTRDLAATKAAGEVPLADSEESIEMDSGGSIDLDVIPESAREAATIDSSGAPDKSATPPSTEEHQDHFTKVTSDRSVKATRVFTPSMLASSAALIGLVSALGWMIWHLTRPYDADTLYLTIRPDATAPDIDQMRSDSDHIDEFLTRFPDDPRSKELQDYAEELELDRLERRFASLARRRAGNEELLTIERLYLESIQLASLQPDLAAKQLGELIALFDFPVPVDVEVSEAHRQSACLELSRRQLARLEKRLLAEQELDIAAIEARLEAIAALHADDPQRAIAACNALFELYQSRPWASEVVQEAQALLTTWTYKPDNPANRN